MIWSKSMFSTSLWAGIIGNRLGKGSDAFVWRKHKLYYMYRYSTRIWAFTGNNVSGVSRGSLLIKGKFHSLGHGPRVLKMHFLVGLILPLEFRLPAFIV